MSVLRLENILTPHSTEHFKVMDVLGCVCMHILYMWAHQLERELRYTHVLMFFTVYDPKYPMPAFCFDIVH